MSGTTNRCTHGTGSGRCPRNAMHGSTLCWMHRLRTAEGIGAAVLFLGVAIVPIVALVSSFNHSPGPAEIPILRLGYLVAYDDCALDLMQQGRLAQACALEGSPVLLGNEVSQFWDHLYQTVWRERTPEDGVEYDDDSAVSNLAPKVVRKVRLSAGDYCPPYIIYQSDRDGAALLRTYTDGRGQPGFFGVNEEAGCAQWRSVAAREFLQRPAASRDLLTRALAEANPACSDLALAEPVWGCGMTGEGPPEAETLLVRPLRMAMLRVENIGQVAAADLVLKVQKSVPHREDGFRLSAGSVLEQPVSASTPETIEWKSLAPGEQLLVPLCTVLDLPAGDDHWLTRNDMTGEGRNVPNWLTASGPMSEMQERPALRALVPEYADVAATSADAAGCPVNTRYSLGPSWQVASIQYRIPTSRKQAQPVPSLDRLRLARVSEYVEGGGCCPLVSTPGTEEFHVLDKCEGPRNERWEVHPVADNATELLIREKDDECGFLDAVLLVGRNREGQAVVVRPSHMSLGSRDGTRLRLAPHQRLALRFHTSDLAPGSRAVKVCGYYTKLRGRSSLPNAQRSESVQTR